MGVDCLRHERQVGDAPPVAPTILSLEDRVIDCVYLLVLDMKNMSARINIVSEKSSVPILNSDSYVQVLHSRTRVQG